MSRKSVEMSRRTFLLATATLAAACTIRTEPSGHLRLAAGDPGGLYLAFAQLLAKQLNTRYPGITVDVLATEGTVENLALLRAGRVDLGLALADVAEQDRATGTSDTAPKAVARVYENYLQVIVRETAAAKQLSDLKGQRVSIGPSGSGAAATSELLFETAGLGGVVVMVNYRLKEGLAHLADGSIDALVWSGGVPTPAIAELDEELPLRMLDIGAIAGPMSRRAGYPYFVHRVPAGGYVPPGIRSIGVPDLLLVRHDVAADLVAAVVDVLATDAARLVPPYVRGLQYLGPPSMIQTGVIPLHEAAIGAYRALHG
ncbi:TAXI family TRAP transporter solute-binding subunit [Mycobacterium sp. NPDC048908]|uniref:TAXI family TRAP transporter solute-binding subunit n=1 Tax=Mycobacterium sp. NPDC048908 TaxID=3364292 RepID=UPI003716A2CD